MATFTDIHPFSPKFRSARTTCAPCESAGASTGNTQHTCAGPTECARPHVHPPPAQHPTHNAAAHTTTYSSVAAVINSYRSLLARSSASFYRQSVSCCEKSDFTIFCKNKTLFTFTVLNSTSQTFTVPPPYALSVGDVGDAGEIQ